jgi:ABC-type sugar transport system, permease component
MTSSLSRRHRVGGLRSRGPIDRNVTMRVKEVRRRVVSYSLLVLASVGALLPIYWIVNTSLKPERNVVSSPPEWVPSPITLDNYANVINNSTLPTNFYNSLIVAAFTIILVLLVGIHAGYAAARFTFRGKESVMFVMLSTIMLPGIVTLIPQYLLAVSLGIYDTYLVLVLVFAAAQTPVVVWILRASFESVPRELDEAAMVDGCSRLGAFYRVVLRLALPGIAAAALLTFVGVWNEFILALNLTASDEVRPATVALYFFLGEDGVQWGRLAAASTLVVLPVCVVFIFLQKRFVAGLTAGATKG